MIYTIRYKLQTLTYININTKALEGDKEKTLKIKEKKYERQTSTKKNVEICAYIFIFFLH